MWRQGIGKKYLHTGKMVKPYKVKCQSQIIHGIKGKDRYYDEVYTSAWTDSETVGQFLINYNNRNVMCEVELPDGEYILYKDNENSQKISGGSFKLELESLSVVLIETL